MVFPRRLSSPEGHQGDSIQAVMAVMIAFFYWRSLRHKLPMRWQRSARKVCTRPSRNSISVGGKVDDMCYCKQLFTYAIGMQCSKPTVLVCTASTREHQKTRFFLPSSAYIRLLKKTIDNDKIGIHSTYLFAIVIKILHTGPADTLKVYNC